MMFKKYILGTALIMVLALVMAGCGAENPGSNLNEEVEQGVDSGQQEEAGDAGSGKAEDQGSTETAAETEETKGSEEEAVEERPEAVDFTMTDWQGSEISLSQYRGKIVFLNFFATWCPPCQAEMPEFQEAYEAYDGDVVFLIVDDYKGERPGTSVDDVKQWYSDGGYTMPMIIDEEGDLREFYGARAYPTTYVIDRDGGVVGYLEGAMNQDMIEQVLAQVE